MFLHYLLFLILSRSRSVVQVHFKVQFEPSKVNVFNKDCVRGGKRVTCMAAIVCIKVKPQTEIRSTQKIGR